MILISYISRKDAESNNCIAVSSVTALGLGMWEFINSVVFCMDPKHRF